MGNKVRNMGGIRIVENLQAIPVFYDVYQKCAANNDTEIMHKQLNFLFYFFFLKSAETF